MKKLIYFILFLFGFQIYSQFEIPEKPNYQTSIYDYIGLLEDDQSYNLERKLIKYSYKTTTQIVIVIISSTNGEDIGILTPKWGHKWGVGQEKEDNGVLILLAKDDRKIWISPGYGVEHKLTAGKLGEIIRNRIIPEFKKNDYYKGLDKGVNAVFKQLSEDSIEYAEDKREEGEEEYRQYTPKDETEEESISLEDIILKILFYGILILIFYFIGGNSGSSGSNWNSGSSSGWSSGGSSSSGGFSGGFGGGGFSGGGAGGSW